MILEIKGKTWLTQKPVSSYGDDTVDAQPWYSWFVNRQKGKYQLVSHKTEYGQPCVYQLEGANPFDRLLESVMILKEEGDLRYAKIACGEFCYYVWLSSPTFAQDMEPLVIRATLADLQELPVYPA